ncbi:MAG: YdcF family protein [Sulfuritalea sp.]|jgi:uncharacterized SAM-binding protein YcdF (DUF218 family)|nr:YdcF family protein [Sulfuritalea sp.]
MFLLKKILAALILPPAGPILLALFGLWLLRAKSRRWQHGGAALATLSLLGLLVLSLPVVGNALMAPLEPHPPIAPEQLRRVQAIVILGGGSYFAAPEYGGDTVSHYTLERLRYGARLGRESSLPVLVTGGAPFGGRAEAESMREALERDFGIKVRWVETASRDTAENARLSAPLLKAAGVTRIALVSHGWHLPRAIELFEKQGIEVTPAPTAFSTGSPSLLEDLLPGGLVTSRLALREYLGRLYNFLKEW